MPVEKKNEIHNLPTITVVIPTFNSKATIVTCLTSIRKQKYPQHKITIILVDGGSTDTTQDITKKFQVTWLTVDPKKQNVEYNKSTGIQKAKSELLLMLDHDNVLPTETIISEMVQPFRENPEVVGVTTMRYQHDKRNTLLDRYFALFGVNDPLPFYLGKADRLPYLYDTYYKKYDPIDRGIYYNVTFTPENIPTIGANGFMVRREILVKHAKSKPGEYFPIDVNVDLVRKGFRTYAITKNAISHLSGHGSILYYVQRRMLFIKQYYLSEDTIYLQSARRFSVYESKDFWKLVYFVLISVTIIVPLFDSIRGYAKVRDVAWFIHPLICFTFVVIYGYVIVEHQAKILVKKVFT